MSQINPGIERIIQAKSIRVKPVAYYVDGIVKQRDHLILAEAITLLESKKADHRPLALEVLAACNPHRIDSRRIAVTGSPGVGKSTFIENLGDHLAPPEHSMAILTIDPTSEKGQGSILGDKTRMERLAAKPNIFIRPSPSGKHLGGLNENTFESIILCEAAGMETICVETVGAGQTDVEVTDFTDCTILLLAPGEGDQLQGMKKGIVEIGDIIIIHKADGSFKKMAEQSKQVYQSAIHLKSADPRGWDKPILTYSSMEPGGEAEIIKQIDRYFELMSANGTLKKRRNAQERNWLTNSILKDLQKLLVEQVRKSSQIQEVLNSDYKNPFSTLRLLRERISISISLK